MSKYQNILVAVDLSPHSEITLKHAVKVAQDFSATLSLVHIIEHSPAAYGGDFSIPLDANLEETIEHQANIAVNSLGEQFGIAPDNLYVKAGSVKVAINKLAAEIKADLIVVGSHNHSPLELLLGSRANAILHLAKRDVWVVKNNQELS